jgi:hypothetical protein
MPSYMGHRDSRQEPNLGMALSTEQLAVPHQVHTYQIHYRGFEHCMMVIMRCLVVSKRRNMLPRRRKTVVQIGGSSKQLPVSTLVSIHLDMQMVANRQIARGRRRNCHRNALIRAHPHRWFHIDMTGMPQGPSFHVCSGLAGNMFHDLVI